MTEAPVWRRLLLADSIYLGAAAMVAVALGTVGDQLFRNPPLGWSYQNAAQRVLSSSSPGTVQHLPINIVGLDEVATLLGRPDVILLDARPQVFFEMGHLPGARSLSREQFETDFLSLEPTLRVPGKTLLVYCSDASCEDSALVARALQARGFGSLLIFPGGFEEWEAAGQPAETTP